MPTEKLNKNIALDLIIPIEYPYQIISYKKQLAEWKLLQKIVPCSIESTISKLKIMFGGKKSDYYDFIREFFNSGLITKNNSRISLNKEYVDAYLEKLINAISEYEKQFRMGFENETMH